MDVAGGLSLVQTIIQVLDSSIWSEMKNVLGVKSQLEKLRVTMFAIKDMLSDAEKEEQQPHYAGRGETADGKLRRLKEALYEADDLFDEVATLALREQHEPGSLFFLKLRSSFTWSGEIKKIRGKLGDIKNDYELNFGLMRHSVDNRVRHNPRETHSFVGGVKDDIIGRDDDKWKVMDMLSDDSVEENVSIVSIVGIGGLGKTTLAQFVYNDEGIQSEFPLKMWVCVSDDFDVRALLGKILVAATKETGRDGSNMDQLQMNLRQQLDGKKYLLVLDDVWNQDPIKWDELRKLLSVGGKGSRIIVTTRSIGVAKIVNSHHTHELKGLSEEASWNLFERMTLETGQHQMQAHLVDIGKEIVRKCAYVPLFIKVAGSFLRGQDESQWIYLNNTDLAGIKQDDKNGIVPVLKISYNHLPYELKSCFSYCAVFPKDSKIIKKDLIYLWMAQGFILPLDGKSFEDVGEEYFKQLLQRCFFQDVEIAQGTLLQRCFFQDVEIAQDTNDAVISFKMHDLIHDLAKEVAGTEILSSNCSTRCFNEKPRHVYIDESTPPENLLGILTKMNRTRTLLCDRYHYLENSLIEKSEMRYLRALTLVNTNNYYLSWRKKLTSVIGKMLHLRYLDLSHNSSLLVLPSSITNLYNLQTLKLYKCCSLKRLPSDLRKLVNLRYLDIDGCSSLTCMPPGMDRMRCLQLQDLTRFVIGGTGNPGYRTSSAAVGELVNLKRFTRHSVVLEISVEKGVKYNAVEGGEGGFLSESKKLREIKYKWNISESDGSDIAEPLLQSLQPHSNLRNLFLEEYPGVRLPGWGGLAMNLSNCLPNLVEIEIRDCKRLEHLPMMSHLQHLEVLFLYNLREVEYVESSSNNNGGEDKLVFFPSLEKLNLGNMPKLKGWWESELGKGETQLQEAPKLCVLKIYNCPNLTIFPFCPKLESLTLHGFNEALGPIMREATQQKEEGRYGRLRGVEIDNVAYLNSLPIHHLSRLEILFNHNIERLRIEEVGEVFRSSRLSSLRSLKIYDCKKLKSISGGRGVWEHFTALESLKLQDLPKLELEDEDDVSNSTNECTKGSNYEGNAEAEMPWRYLAPTLRSLELFHLPKVVKLPKGIGCLSSLHSLNIWFCHNLESLTPSIGGLSSLHSLVIRSCDNLESLTPSIGGLSSLQSLKIEYCPKLKTMPEEMRHLTSLTRLNIEYCTPELKKRCEKHTGIYWPYIQHIPNITVKSDPDLYPCWKNCFGQ